MYLNAKDVPENFSVFIDQESIDQSKCGDKENCAVSVAVNKFFGNDTHVKTQPLGKDPRGLWVVSVSNFDESDDAYHYGFYGDEDFGIWVMAFDAKLKVNPITIDFSCDDKKDVIYNGKIKLSDDYNIESQKKQLMENGYVIACLN